MFLWLLRGKYGFNLSPSSLYSCPRRTSWFLEAVVTTWSTTTLASNTTNHEISCHSAHQVPCLILWESTTLVYLAIYDCCSQRFLCHNSYICTCLNHKLELCGWDSMHAHAQCCVFFTSTLDIMHVIKYARLSLTLAGITRLTQIHQSLGQCCWYNSFQYHVYLFAHRNQ